MLHGEKIVDGIKIKYLCQPCPQCKAKLELFARYKMVLEGLTPGGSEYVNDPERCGVMIREIMRGPVALLRRQKAKVEAAEEMARAWRKMLILSYSDDPNDWVLARDEGATALAAWEKAGKGE